MKKFICILLIAMACFATSFAQEDILKFKGIPIEGSIDTYKNKIAQLGYKYKGIIEGRHAFEGQFTKENCVITLEPTNDNQIAAVMVHFTQEYQSWQSIDDAFQTLKAALIQKYNCQPNEVNEILEWADGHSPYSDGMKLYALKSDECNHLLQLKVKGGFISLIKTPAATLSLTYFSNKSAEQYNQEKYEDL